MLSRQRIALFIPLLIAFLSIHLIAQAAPTRGSANTTPALNSPPVSSSSLLASETMAFSAQTSIPNTQCSIEAASPIRYVDQAHASATDTANSCTSSAAPCATIQHAIDQSADHDVIRVAPGTYVENVNYDGKDITVVSDFYWSRNRSDIMNTVIDGNAAGSVVSLHNGESMYAQMIGLRIRNGSGTYIDDTDYWGTSFGAHRGGGFVLRNAQPMLCSLVIENNTAQIGAGVYSLRSQPTVSGTIIQNNTVIAPHAAGGGIYLESHSPYEPKIINTVIANNSAEYGGGIYDDYSTKLKLMHVTITGNSATVQGGGILRANAATISMTNSIVYDNSPASIDWRGGSVSPSTIMHSAVETMGDPHITYGTGVITADPLLDTMHRLTSSSPAIDQGTSTAITADLEHTSRDAAPDMGAYEYSALSCTHTVPTLLHSTSPTSFEAIELPGVVLPPLSEVTNSASAVCNGTARPMKMTPVDGVNFITEWHDGAATPTMCYSHFTPIGSGLYSEADMGVWPADWSLYDAADVNGDGIDDLLIVHRVSTGYSDYEYKVALGLGGGSFDFSATPITIVTNKWLFKAALGDIDGDTHVDLVYFSHTSGGSFSPNVYIRHGDGTGAFGSQTLLFNSPTSAETPLLADFDADGDLDIYLPSDDDVANWGAGRLAENDGSGGFAGATPSVDCSTINTSGTDDGVFRAQAADVDLDGHLDLICTQYPWAGSTYDYSVDVYRGNGDLTFAAIGENLWSQPHGDRPNWHQFTWTEAPTCEPDETLLSLYAFAGDNEPDDPGSLVASYPSTIDSLVAATAAESDKIAVVLADLDKDGDTHILHIANGVVTAIAGLPDATGMLDVSLNEYDMTNGDQVGAFIQWARGAYAATQTTFTFIGHGAPLVPDTDVSALITSSRSSSTGLIPLPAGWIEAGANWTDNTDGGLLSPYDLAKALSIGTNDGADPLALVDVSHCFASTIEEYHELSNPDGAAYADVLTGSPNYAYYAGDMAGKALTAMTVGATSADLGSAVINSHGAVLNAGDAVDGDPDVEHPALMVVVDSTKVPAVKDKIDEMSWYIDQAFDINAADTLTKLTNAYDSTAHYYDTTYCPVQDWALAPPDAVVDISPFMQRLAAEFGPFSGVTLRALQVDTMVSAAVLDAHATSGTAWFGSMATWDLAAPERIGLGIYADFVGRSSGSVRYLGWQGAFYNDTVSSTNPNPYLFVQDGPLGTSWATVVNRLWAEKIAIEGLTLETEACLPEFPAVMSIGELAVEGIIFPHPATSHAGYPSKLAANISTAHVANNPLVAFTVYDSGGTTVYSNTIGAGHLVTGTHYVEASADWIPAASGVYTIEVMVDADNRFIETNESDNSQTQVDTATSSTPFVMTATIEANLQWSNTPTVPLELDGSAPIDWLIVQLFEYVASTDPNTQVPILNSMLTIPAPALPTETITLPATIPAGNMVVHMWGIDSGGALNQSAEVDRINYAPTNHNIGVGQTYYLFDADSGDNLTLSLNVPSGTVSMWVWQPNNSWTAQVITGTGNITFNPAFVGEYTVMVEGSSADATYTLTSDRNSVFNGRNTTSNVTTVQRAKPELLAPTQVVPNFTPTAVTLLSSASSTIQLRPHIVVMLLLTALTALSLYHRRSKQDSQ